MRAAGAGVARAGSGPARRRPARRVFPAHPHDQGRGGPAGPRQDHGACSPSRKPLRAAPVWKPAAGRTHDRGDAAQRRLPPRLQRAAAEGGAARARQRSARGREANGAGLRAGRRAGRGRGSGAPGAAGGGDPTQSPGGCAGRPHAPDPGAFRRRTGDGGHQGRTRGVAAWGARDRGRGDPGSGRPRGAARSGRARDRPADGRGRRDDLERRRRRRRRAGGNRRGAARRAAGPDGPGRGSRDRRDDAGRRGSSRCPAEPRRRADREPCPIRPARLRHGADLQEGGRRWPVRQRRAFPPRSGRVDRAESGKSGGAGGGGLRGPSREDRGSGPPLGRGSQALRGTRGVGRSPDPGGGQPPARCSGHADGAHRTVVQPLQAFGPRHRRRARQERHAGSHRREDRARQAHDR